MTEKYILVSDEEYCYILNTQSEHYKTLEDFEKQEFENAKKDNVDINEYEDEILQLANDNYWDWIYNNHLEADTVNDIINELTDKNEQLKQQNKELKETLLSALNQLYSSESSLIYEYSTDISNDEKELAEHFKEKYSKYGWSE